MAGSGFEQDLVRGAGPALAVRRTVRGLPPVVFVHGITDDAACGQRLAERVAAECPVDAVTVDARGHGASEWSEDYRMAPQVDDLVRVCDLLGLRSPVLVGHSMGGAHVAAAAPRVDASAVVVLDPHWPAETEDATTYDVPAWRSDVAAEAATPLADLVVAGRLAHPRWHEDDLHRWALAKRSVDPAVTGWVLDHDAINAWRSRVTRLRCPLLLVTADRAADPAVTVDDDVAAEVAVLRPGTRRTHVPGAGHSVHRDDLEAVAHAVTAFLGAR